MPSRAMLIFSIMLLGCDSRSLNLSPDGSYALDGAQTQVDSRRSGVDSRRSGDAAVKKPFLCTGETKASRNGQALEVRALETGTTAIASFSGSSEFLRFVTHGSLGEEYIIIVELLHYPGAAPVSHIDLAHPPEKHFVIVRCEPYEGCGLLSTTDPSFVGFTGTVDFEPVPNLPATKVTLCLSVSVLRPYLIPAIPEGFDSLELWTDHVLVNQACEAGIHATCNYNLLISSLKGTCNADSTCTCNADSIKDPVTGKCH